MYNSMSLLNVLIVAEQEESGSRNERQRHSLTKWQVLGGETRRAEVPGPGGLRSGLL
jgi:hypothetical protein